MKFWEDNRLEYFKQPHIVLLGILLLAVCIGAAYTSVSRIKQMQNAANAGTYEACQQFIEDNLLCRFASAHEQDGSQNYTITSTTTNGDVTEVSTIEVTHADKMKSVTLAGLKEIEAYIVIDETTYVKDYADNVWAKYADPDFTPSQHSIQYDFSNAYSEDVIEFRDYYKNVGTEPCGELKCHKYEVRYPDDDGVTYLWFDTDNFLLRRLLSNNPDSTTNNQFTYGSVIIEAPSPTKDVSADEIESYL